jgi:hypothetical protein
VQYVLPDRGVLAAQAVLGGIAFVVLAVALAATLHDWRARLAVMSVVLLLGLAPRVTYWDAMMLSESIAISLTALLIAALVHIDRLPVAAFAALFAVWVFTRDAHLYLGVMLLMALAIWGWYQRRLAVPLAMAAVLAWASMAAANDDTIEGYNVVANVAHRIAPDDAQWLWFQAEGMPDSNRSTEDDPYGHQAALINDPDFWEWSVGAGAGTYTHFLLAHPLFTLGALRHMIVDGGIVDEALVDHTNSRIVTTPGPEIVWPREASSYTVLVVAAALIGSYVVFRRRRLDGRWLLPALLAVSSVPHAMLAYHASPFEIARHGVILAFVLVVAGWWTIALVVDSVLTHRLDDAGGDASRPRRELELAR